MPKHTFGSLTDEDEDEDLSLPPLGYREYINPLVPSKLQRDYGTKGYEGGKEHVFFKSIAPEPTVVPDVAPDVAPDTTLPKRDAVAYVDEPSDNADQEDEDDADAADADAAAAADAEASISEEENEEDPGFSGEEGDPSEGKIVCTAMNSMYGFGGFRNAIWMKYARERIKDEEYELGYHKLIMPLVRRMETNKFIRTIVEFNARQRTFNLRREMRGQKTTLYYRIVEKKIIFPAFFAVGWLVKKNILKKAKI